MCIPPHAYSPRSSALLFGLCHTIISPMIVSLTIEIICQQKYMKTQCVLSREMMPPCPPSTSIVLYELFILFVYRGCIRGLPQMWKAPLYVSADTIIIMHFCIFEAAASQEVPFGRPMPTVVAFQGN